jgi:choline monooxygenase
MRYALFTTDDDASEFARTERRRVFRRSWQLVARAAQVARPGDLALAEVDGLPLVIVRGDDGVLRAFHNVCRHRAGPVAVVDGRAVRALVCRYHGWTYALDGRLRGAPEMDGVPGFDAATIRLPEARVAEWNGLVFVAADDGAPDFGDVVGGIDDRMGRGRLDGYAFHSRATWDIACNWKVYVENYLEGYHLRQVHPGLARVLDWRSYETLPADWSVLQWSPLESRSDGPYAAGDALYWWLWPNTMLNVLPGRLQTNRVIPLAVDRCRVEFDSFYPADADPARIAADLAFSAEVQAEDIAICEAVQRGLASGSYTPGPLHPVHEAGIVRFHRLLDAALGEDANARN